VSFDESCTAVAVALITGGASGMGASFARNHVGQGGRVVIVDRDLEAAQALAEELGPNALIAEADVAEEADMAAALHVGVEAFGRVDGYFLNAGVGSSTSIGSLPSTCAECSSVCGSLCVTRAPQVSRRRSLSRPRPQV
jgi:NADP-dependent 3-hydroxy acid dehydrogenase YdfG